MAYLGDSGLGYFLRLQSRCQPELQSSEGLTGAGGPSSKVVHAHHCWLVSFGFEKETLVTHCGVFSIGMLSCLTHGSWFFRVSEPRESKVEATMPFMIYSQKSHTVIVTVFYWSHRSSLCIVGGWLPYTTIFSPFGWKSKRGIKESNNAGKIEKDIRIWSIKQVTSLWLPWLLTRILQKETKEHGKRGIGNITLTGLLVDN